MNDPRENIEHVIEAGQVYTDARTGESLHLIFLDELNVLLRSTEDQSARLGNRKQFEKDVGSGRYTVTGEVDVIADVVSDGRHTAIDWTDVSGVGQTTAVALQKAGYTTDRDILAEADDVLLDIRGVGAGNLCNMREYVGENRLTRS
jgi:hypothetical protein